MTSNSIVVLLRQSHDGGYADPFYLNDYYSAASDVVSLTSGDFNQDGMVRGLSGCPSGVPLCGTHGCGITARLCAAPLPCRRTCSCADQAALTRCFFSSSTHTCLGSTMLQQRICPQPCRHVTTQSRLITTLTETS